MAPQFANGVHCLSSDLLPLPKGIVFLWKNMTCSPNSYAMREAVKDILLKACSMEQAKGFMQRPVDRLARGVSKIQKGFPLSEISGEFIIAGGVSKGRNSLVNGIAMNIAGEIMLSYRGRHLFAQRSGHAAQHLGLRSGQKVLSIWMFIRKWNCPNL